MFEAFTPDSAEARPAFSVVVPTFNGASFLPSCLDSLRRQTLPDFEVVVVDDGSTDGSVDLVEQSYPEVKLVALGVNSGFAAAANRGLAAARGEIIALLNNDVEADERWLGELQAAAQIHPEYDFFASKILLFDRRDTLHSAGDYYTLAGVPGNRGVWQKDEGQFDRVEEVFGACGGAAAYRRAFLEALRRGEQVFDESLFMYCEDVDLNLRARLRGFRCLFVPGARVYHRLSATGGGALASYYCGRNFIGIALADLPRPLVWRHWRRILAAQLGFTGESFRHLGEPAARARLRGQLAALGRLPLTLRKRQIVQHQRVISDVDFEAMLERS
jgi:GT2 family glycosyltransferase